MAEDHEKSNLSVDIAAKATLEVKAEIPKEVPRDARSMRLLTSLDPLPKRAD